MESNVRISQHFNGGIKERGFRVDVGVPDNQQEREERRQAREEVARRHGVDRQALEEYERDIDELIQAHEEVERALAAFNKSKN